MAEKLTIDNISTFCKSKGFIYPSSEIYGGMSGFFDYGPLGAELKNNIKQAWWKFHVQDREDIVGIDASIIMHPNVWKASGHVANFEDILVECTKCKERYRADHLIEEALKIQADGLKADDIQKLIEQNKIKCPKCKSALDKPGAFNLMFQTYVGPKQSKESIAYLRPETAQAMFVDFKQVVETARLKLPFGIAQVGRAFRNEISPRNFLFRCREFEQMEIEYFIHPGSWEECPYVDEIMDHEIFVYSAEMQQKKEKGKKMKMKEALSDGIIKSPWHAYWLATEHKWFVNLGANPNNFRVRQHLPDEKAHYSKDCWDLEYNFPFGFKELQGISDRGDYDLQQHIKHSKKDLSLFDEETKKKIVPHVVAEPSQGVDRAFLVFLFDAYNDDKERGNIVLKLNPRIAPVKVGFFPLMNKLDKEAREIYNCLRKLFVCQYDKSGSIGRRYARADEIGIPYCVTVDFDTKEKKEVTIRDRDSTKQIRVQVSELKNVLYRLIVGEVEFEKAGKLIK
ncbi:glycine--tRNA ligase [Candidatus Woesearchaeota archaeon]|nr:glycine--tRNA ligase [Candidatus Woesearchaeota archaeon]